MVLKMDESETRFWIGVGLITLFGLAGYLIINYSGWYKMVTELGWTIVYVWIGLLFLAMLYFRKIDKEQNKKNKQNRVIQNE